LNDNAAGIVTAADVNTIFSNVSKATQVPWRFCLA
jgi:hypothetical protein